MQGSGWGKHAKEIAVSPLPKPSPTTKNTTIEYRACAFPYTMVPKPQGSAVQSATHRPLPPLPKLRIRRPNKPEANPCLGVMSSVLGCWASSGYSVQGCALLEQKLRQCMDAPRNPNQKKNNINYHLSRMYPKIVGPHKRD
ncbi:37S ribosomal MRP10 mitochondrial [Pyrenophora seminiperda CCB06]|uniref:37S ribosomal MRP10 mitochondrial n=1 Tax=Pyrenophora seminiperda CCB06 TaxID=1302712 RepID=A0A3M7MJ38_9PLEO|nr:37S ribosomal MRP10 mitochondrial [Pyrenophora seminiperda CCB06]